MTDKQMLIKLAERLVGTENYIVSLVIPREMRVLFPNATLYIAFNGTAWYFDKDDTLLTMETA